MNSELTVEQIWRLTAHKNLRHVSDKCRSEWSDLSEILPHLWHFIKIDDIRFGEPPGEPDFVFTFQNGLIGVELTILNPKLFEKGGFRERGEFKKWEAAADSYESRQEFNWGTYTLRDSLTAFRAQLDSKQMKAKMWSKTFPERWLLAHIASGSPFAEVLPADWNATPGQEAQVAEYFAKASHELHAACKNIAPFDYVILFSSPGFVAIPSDPRNPRAFPQLNPEVVKRGAGITDEFLDWTRGRRTVRQPFDIREGPPSLRKLKNISAKPPHNAPEPGTAP